MRENLGRKGRVSKAVKTSLVALLAFFAIGTFTASQANAGQDLKLSFTDSWISVDALAGLAGSFHAIDPADEPKVSLDFTGSLANDGTFTAPKSAFNFPEQVIDAGIAVITLKIEATKDITGTYNRETGAFNADLSLALKVLAPALGETGMACAISPLNIPLSTTGSKNFPIKDSTTPNDKAASAFAGGQGAVLGSWTGVGISDIKDADLVTGEPLDPQPAPEARLCEALIGGLMTGQGVDTFDGSIWLQGTSTITGELDPEVCPVGQVGTPPNCSPEEKKAPKITSVKVGKGKVKAGKTAKIKVTVRNTGNAAFSGKVTLKSSNKQAKVAKSVKVKVAAGKSATVTVKVKTTKKAKGKATITAKVGGKSGKGALTIQKAKKKK